MRATGIVRKIDELGRVVLPIELRRSLEIEEKDGLEIFVDKDRIILKKYQLTCTFCGSTDNVREFKSKIVCSDCWNEIKADT